MNAGCPQSTAPSQMMSTSWPIECVSLEDGVIGHIYNSLEQNHTNPSWFSERTLHKSRNTDVDHVNDKILQRLPGDALQVKSYNTVGETNQAVMYPSEFFNSINMSVLPPH